MSRLKCPKCRNVFELDLSAGVVFGTLHVGPFRLLKCPACGRRRFFNVYSSVNEPVTWPPREKARQAGSQSSEEELEKKQIEESKYESARF